MSLTCSHPRHVLLDSATLTRHLHYSLTCLFLKEKQRSTGVTQWKHQPLSLPDLLGDWQEHHMHRCCHQGHQTGLKTKVSEWRCGLKVKSPDQTSKRLSCLPLSYFTVNPLIRSAEHLRDTIPASRRKSEWARHPEKRATPGERTLDRPTDRAHAAQPLKKRNGVLKQRL